MSRIITLRNQHSQMTRSETVVNEEHNTDKTAESSGTEDDAPDPNRPLDASDRCDSCGAQAYVRAVIADSELLFCAHHARKHEEKLKEIASDWHDETAKLFAAV